MKHLFFFAVIFFYLLLTSAVLLPQEDSIDNLEYYKVSKIKIFINDRSDIKKLREQGINIEQVKVFEKYFETYMDSIQIDNLKKFGYPYEIIIDDVTKDYLERTKESREQIKLKKPSRPVGFGYGSMGGFYTFDEVVAQLDTMRLLYPNLITSKDSIGVSVEGRTIWAVKISDNPDVDEDEPEIFYNSLIHAREPAGMMAVIYFMYYLLENYGTDSEVTYLVDNREFYFVLVINPDGYVYNQQISPDGGGMWRKNLRDNDNNSVINLNDGVDLARNFGYMWGYDNIGSSPNFSYETYRGIGPFSEPESQVIRDFILSKNFKIVQNFHSYWDVIFTPWGYNLTQTPDSIIFNRAIMLGTAFNNYLNGNSYIPGNYPCNGYPCDWIYGEQTIKPKIFSFLTEVGNDNDGFWPIPERIFPLAEENCYLNKIFAWGPGIIDNPPYIIKANLNSGQFYHSPDTLNISALEYNPDNHSSTLLAQVLTLNDSLIIENQLNQIDSSFTGSLFLNSTEENFYKIILQQNGNDIPSKLFYNKLRFTTAGPMRLDSIRFLKGITNYYNLRPFVKNEGTALTITNAKIQLRCNDPWVTAIAGAISIPSISPGLSVGASSWIAVAYDASIFPGYFNLKAEMMVDGWTYWTDSIRINVITGLEEEASFPSAFILEQNFPNPFNNSSAIKYSIPHSSKVIIKVFDVLGDEIEALVNEEKPIGTYELNWNASNLPSGVYFYRLQAGSFVETKKMILLK